MCVRQRELGYVDDSGQIIFNSQVPNNVISVKTVGFFFFRKFVFSKFGERCKRPYFICLRQNIRLPRFHRNGRSTEDGPVAYEMGSTSFILFLDRSFQRRVGKERWVDTPTGLRTTRHDNSVVPCNLSCPETLICLSLSLGLRRVPGFMKRT